MEGKDFKQEAKRGVKAIQTYQNLVQLGSSFSTQDSCTDNWEPADQTNGKEPGWREVSKYEKINCSGLKPTGLTLPHLESINL